MSATDSERTTAKKSARDDYIAGIAIKNCCKTRYTLRVNELKIRHIEGTDAYPSDLTRVLEMLNTWEEVYRATRKGRTNYTDEGGMSFSTNGNQQRGGRGGRGGRGRDRGLGRGGGSGRGSNDS